ncbi:nuclear transport factor 2 family protein [Sphingobacterium sp.]|uniref:nuclear transport factor 2 family protein n=1 Tax=Sphingobacterium sp. TaxID=341027 RepID=UPI00289768E7|nr:nuclear transport factor 2 family protein [Sphingobacterium sp.]
MKTLTKTFAIATLLFVSSVNVFANPIKEEKKALNKAVVENVVDEYINATVKGNTLYISDLFDSNFKQKFNGGKSQKTSGKEDYISFLKKNKGVQYDCEVSYELVEKNSNYSLARVTLDFGNFKRIDYVSINMDKDGWKINEVNSVYQK